MPHKAPRGATPPYRLQPDDGSFVIEDYNFKKPLSNFLPGIAGEWGVPLWAYYVSRGQALCSLGSRDKNGQILEFQSFNLATARVAQEGFRTFLRLDDGKVYEPFQRTRERGISQRLEMAPAEVRLVETHKKLGLELEVLYFALANMPLGGMVRRVRITDTSGKRRKLDWLDGAARILPAGLDYAQVKGVARHVEAMMGVATYKSAALFRLKQTAADSEQVGKLTGGHFFVSPGVRLGRGLIVDPSLIFGDAQQYDHPWRFDDHDATALGRERQLTDNRTPCAFVARTDTLGPRATLELVSVLGAVDDESRLDGLIEGLKKKRFAPQKREENRRVVDEIGQKAFTLSAHPAFDAYTRQSFIDNVMRGGLPKLFETKDGRSAFYLYARQNGDLERDYHFFVLEPTYLSQGTGHYRSVLQNRRTDTFFFPEVEAENVATFMNLIQLDGYNPLEVKSLTYRIVDEDGWNKLLARELKDPKARERMGALGRAGFSPGALVMALEREGAKLQKGREAVLREALALSRQNEVGGLHEGFWVDHWHYNLDLLEMVLAVYPERLEELLLDDARYTFFDDPDVILPRSKRSVLLPDGRVRSYGAVGRDAEKLSRIAARKHDPYVVRARQGKGKVYRTTLVAKLLTLVVNRLATIDPHGSGIEMEAGKPGWNDSMNGLPGLFGSGLSELLELVRAVRWLREATAALVRKKGEREVALFAELTDFLRGLLPVLLRRLEAQDAAGAFAYWDAASSLKETYRERTRLGVLGDEVALSLAEIERFLGVAEAMLRQIVDGPGRKRVLSKEGVPYTYFVNDVTAYETTGDTDVQGRELVRPTAFRQRPVKLFLEGAVHWMKERPNEARFVYDAVRRSPIFDRKLGMYKACEPMQGESYELGRAVGAYPRGWIENESVYLHMEYKYLLEILRSGLSDAFWRDAQKCLMPFMDPEVYGRSTTEGASFLVSSAYADPRLHGQAFQPRLSGITCEMLHIWIVAMAGPAPMVAGDDGMLRLELRPRLPGWLFTGAPVTRPYFDPQDGWGELAVPKGSLAFKLFGHTLVVYENPIGRATYGAKAAAPTHHRLHYRDGRMVDVEGASVPSPHAEAIRRGEVRRVDVTLG